MAVRPSDQPEVLQSYSQESGAAWCDRCEMSHARHGCPPVRLWWVNLVKGRAYKAVGKVAARSAWAAMERAIVMFGELQDDHQHLAVDTNDYIRTAWDRLLGEELEI